MVIFGMAQRVSRSSPNLLKHDDLETHFEPARRLVWRNSAAIAGLANFIERDTGGVFDRLERDASRM
jgi:hypothetical protein